MSEAVRPLLSPEEIEKIPCLKEHLDKLNKLFLKVKTRKELEKVFQEVVWTLRVLVKQKVISLIFSNLTKHHTPFSKNVYASCFPDTEESWSKNRSTIVDFDILPALSLGREDIYAKTRELGYNGKVRPNSYETAFFFSGKSSKKFTPDTDHLSYFSVGKVLFGDGNNDTCGEATSQELSFGVIIDSVFSRVQMKLRAIAAAEDCQQKSDLKHKKPVLQLPPADRSIKNRNSLEGDQDYMRRLLAGTIKIPSL